MNEVFTHEKRRTGKTRVRRRWGENGSVLVEFCRKILPAFTDCKGGKFLGCFQDDQFLVLQAQVAVTEVGAYIAEAAQAGQDVADQGLVLAGARFERSGEIDVDVDDAVAFVEDADGLDVVGTAGAVDGLEGAAE